MATFEEFRGAIDPLLDPKTVTVEQLRTANWDQIAGLLSSSMARVRSSTMSDEERQYLTALPGKIDGLDDVLQGDQVDVDVAKEVDAKLSGIWTLAHTIIKAFGG